MKQAFREFRAAAPTMMRWWLVIAASVFPIGVVLYRISLGEAAALAIAMVPLGFAMIGGMWLHPVFGRAKPTRARFMVGFGWLLVMFLPSVAGTVLALLALRQVFGAES